VWRRRRAQSRRAALDHAVKVSGEEGGGLEADAT
jgi:hypothetical protein